MLPLEMFTTVLDSRTCGSHCTFRQHKHLDQPAIEPPSDSLGPPSVYPRLRFPARGLRAACRVHTFHLNKSIASLAAGNYSNLRIRVPSHGRYSQQEPAQPWKTAYEAGVAEAQSGSYVLEQFASTCYYFGESLTDAMIDAGLEVPPIGLISTAIGGTKIEAWVDNATLDQCSDVNPTSGGGLFENWVLPYAHMTVSGFLW